MGGLPHLVIFDAMNMVRRIYAVHQGQRDASERLFQQSGKLMLDILHRQDASHAVAIFDGDEPGWRHELWPVYKVSRSPLPTELASQLDALQEHWLSLGIDSVLPIDDEADDVIATLACKCEQHGVKVTIVSTDQGFYPLLCPEIHQYDAFAKQDLTPLHYQDKFGISGQQWPVYKALIGDSSSDIPGLSGFGAKTAQAFIQANMNALTLPPAKRKIWLEQQEQFALFKQLMTLECQCELGFKLSDIRWNSCP